MAANSNINSLLIDNTFPIANKSQSSQGFRTNWAAIQNNFNYAKSDILNLQNKTITLTGDVSGTSPILDSGSAGINFSATFSPSGLDNLSPGNYISEFENIITFTVDTRGLITKISSTDRVKTFSDVGTINPISNLDQTKQYSGITSLNIPTITYNEYGLITKIQDNTIQGFGITDLYMPKNSILVGNSSSISSFLPAPSESSVLLFNGSNLTWEQIVSITSVKSGNMIYTNLDTDGNLTISVDYTKLDNISTITNDTEFAIYDGTNYYLTKLSDIITFFDESYKVEIFTDKAPKLGGNLDVNNFSIINSENGIINISSDQINLTSTDKINLNSFVFGTTLPDTSSTLITDSSGNITFQDVKSFTNINNNLTNITLTEDNQTQQIATTNSLNYFIKNNGYTNLNLVFDRTNYNTNSSYNLVYSLYFEITNKDMILNFTGDNSSSVYINEITNEEIGIIESGSSVLSTQVFTTDPSGNNITSNGGNGKGATFTITSSEQNIYIPASVTLNAAGSGYAVNDTITLTNIGTITVITVDTNGAITKITSTLTKTSQNSDMSGTAITGTTSGSGTGATFTVTSTEQNTYTVSSIVLNYPGSGYKKGDILNITGGFGTYTVDTVTPYPTNLTLSQGYIYKINVEYYGNDCWILDVVFKSEKS